jgi:E3 ubiquitin-protein ligase RNF14
MNGRHHRHHQQQHHRAKSKLRYVNKSELVSSPNSVSDVEKRVSPEDVNVNVNNNNNNVDDVASSSKTKEEDNDDGIDIMDDRLDKLLSDIQQPELSQEQIIINDQLQQDEVFIKFKYKKHR